MGELNSLETQIRSSILQKFPLARRRTLDESTPLLESGIIDSLGVLDLVSFLEQSFAIQVADDELTPDNFATIASLTAFVEKKRSVVEVSTT
jgi:acyl carrier protein